MAIRSVTFHEQEVDGTPGGGGNNPSWGPDGTPDRPPLPTSQQSDEDNEVGQVDWGVGA